MDDTGHSAPAEREPWLDAVRGLAVLLVVGHHAFPNAGTLEAVAAPWRTGGWVGVELFFALSGYLLGRGLLHELRLGAGLQVGRFYARRAWRILPPFLALCAFTLAVRAGLGMPLPWPRVAGELLMLQNHLGRLWLHTWSLAVEWHAYLVLPWLFLLGGRARGWLLLAVAVASPLLRAWVWAPVPGGDPLPMGTPFRLDSISLGALAAVVEGRLAAVPRGRRALALPALALLLPLFLVPLGTATWLPWLGPLMAGGAGVLLVVAAPVAPVPSGLGWLAAVGRRSYSLYLWHVPVWGWGQLALTRRGVGLGSEGLFLVLWAVSIAAGWFAAFAVESRTQRWRVRFHGE